jgi:SNF2 family DNA or RNA helicase
MPEEFQNLRDLGAMLRDIGATEEAAQKCDGIEFPFDLMQHQKESIHAGLYYKQLGLFHEPRCGKTAVMQGLTIVLAKNGSKCIVMMPPALFLQYESEMNKIKNHGLTLHRFTDSPKKRDQLLTAWRKDHRTSPDVLLMSTKVFVKHSEALMQIGYQGLFYDECHMGLQKETTQIYHAVENFRKRMGSNGRVVLSTGTPMPNNIYNAYPIISIKTPGFYQSRGEFNARHVTFRKMTVRTKWGEKLVDIPDQNAYTGHERLNYAMYANAVRKTKMEVLNLQAPNISMVPVRLSNQHLSAYRQLIRTKMVEFIDGEVIDARSEQKLRQLALQGITDPSLLTSDGHAIKQNAVLETVQALLDSVGAMERTKVVLFAYYQNTIRLLENHFKAYQPATIYGENGAEKNQQNLHRFQENGLCRLLIANPISGGTGVTAGHVSQTAIFVEPVSTPGQFEQAGSRIMLVGQTEPVSIYVLEILNTLSPTLIKLMLGKIKDLDEVMRDPKTMFDALLGKL